MVIVNACGCDQLTMTMTMNTIVTMIVSVVELWTANIKSYSCLKLLLTWMFILQVMYTDRPLVVCAPTGSGKTVIFELAIIRLLMSTGVDIRNVKIVYST